MADYAEIHSVPQTVAVRLRLEATVQRHMTTLLDKHPIAGGCATLQIGIRLQVHLDRLKGAVHDGLRGSGQRAGDRGVGGHVLREEVLAAKLPRAFRSLRQDRNRYSAVESHHARFLQHHLARLQHRQGLGTQLGPRLHDVGWIHAGDLGDASDATCE
eukprot:CAMPEP_0171323426 /NCGR_PEP_ID=MMETSP0816-20121228/115566_1 /TAXON_ID=420281 /ORGANISM="Proboscia inermis, Strain CCAP1064/1" /LENGTH=157 /DNA_ID=CAMNT_0011822131 /DNA_START=845 /DNA_END=1315 /DNA_ORIENTATION=-